MMNSKGLLTITIILLISLTSCRFWGVRGSGDIESEKREVNDFQEIEISGAYEVDIFVGEKTGVELSGDDNLLKYIDTYVRGNTLVIESRKDLKPRKGIKIKITTPELEVLSLSGASDVFIEGLDEGRFYLDMSGACSIEAEGIVGTFKLELSGAGSVNARHLKAEDVVVSISGASSASVYASNSLDASVSGVGSVSYYGDPEYVDTDVSGIGSINRK
ncbi:MAG: DUF2807 domain-containing protein [Bacteroidetes bacterium]|nr:DUF2807 domain-containing protein [Bacteroidota bacterium]